MSKIVFSVGQCGMDHGSITEVCKKAGGATVNIESARSLFDSLKQTSPALILVNRVLDSDGDSGLEIIKKLKADSNTKNIPVMLVSNYEDAQNQAISSGALPGFGKNNLRAPDTIYKLAKVLE